MLGQEEIIKYIDNLVSIPKSILIEGKKGSGKHLILNYIQEKLKLPSVDISDNVELDTLLEISTETTPKVYIIDTTLITEKEQNVILKFIEEPPINAYVVLLTEDRNSIISTIPNRCVVLTLKPYSKEVLETFVPKGVDKELALKLCDTPGKLKELTSYDITQLSKLCNTIISSINRANFSNTLTISNKINLKNDSSKFDLNAFFNCMSYLLLDNYSKTFDNKIIEMYNICKRYQIKFQDSRLNKEYLFNNFLTTLWLSQERREV